MFNELLPFDLPYQEGAMVRKGGGAGKVLLGDINCLTLAPSFTSTG